MVLRLYLAFSGWFCVRSGGEMWQKLGKLSIIDQVLVVLGQLLHRLWFGFLSWLQQRL